MGVAATRATTGTTPAVRSARGGGEAVFTGDAQRGGAPSAAGVWSAVGSTALCVSLLMTAEFMPVSLLTPIVQDLGATVGMAGQAISASRLLAAPTSLLIATAAARFDRRPVPVGLTGVMLGSLMPIALAPNYAILMVARALLGVVIGGLLGARHRDGHAPDDPDPVRQTCDVLQHLPEIVGPVEGSQVRCIKGGGTRRAAAITERPFE